MYYPTIGERACTEDELSGDSFYITVSNLDLNHGFDYIRLYSIVKTTNNATPIVRIVDDKPLKGLISNSSVTFHDTNTTGKIIDPDIIQFIGGKEIVAHTFDQKDNTLFLGNIEIKTPSINTALKNSLNAHAKENLVWENDATVIRNNISELGIREESAGVSVYQWINQLNPHRVQKLDSSYSEKNPNSQYIKHFKYNEMYRFGIQFQNNKGIWSEVAYLDDKTNDVQPYTVQNNTECLFGYIKYTLPTNVKQSLIADDYKKARLVCCYPTNADRSIIAQGVLCPTIKNNHWREIHAPDAISSWFFRPNDKINYFKGEYKESDIHPWNINDFDTTVLPWKHDKALDEAFYLGFNDHGHKWYLSVPEVQSTFHNNLKQNDIESTIYEDFDAPEEDKSWSWEEDDSIFKVDKQILTFHSPDIEFDESLRTLPSENWCVRVIGKIPINSFAAKYYIDADLPAAIYNGDKAKGLLNELYSRPAIIPNNISGSHQAMLGRWNDTNLYTSEKKGKEFVDYCLYPFQRKSSLNNYIRDIEDWKVNKYWKSESEATFPIRQSSTLHTKVLSHILYSTTSEYQAIPAFDILNPNDTTQNSLINSSRFEIYDSNEPIPFKIKNTGDDLIYYGNVDNIAPVSKSFKGYILHGYDPEGRGYDNAYNNYQMSGSYPIATIKKLPEVYALQYDFAGVDQENKNENNGGAVYVSDPVPITYKSTAHGVFYTEALHSTTGDLGYEDGEGFESNTPYLYLAEVYLNRDNDTTRFGGDPTLGNSVNNIYVPCGPVIDINTSDTLYGFEGDTYYMRYDNLKTYPNSKEDINQIVEILSFMVETRINLDGRCDKNRGLLDNTMISNTNFNYINKSYTQDNNTFTFTTLDEMSADIDKFANQITWTKEKVSGEDTDAWTNITLASTADADGTLGSITKILNYNNRLLMFQDHGLSQINYNENTAISTESGVPLELSKTGKYTGLNYITREVGCQNKWSISLSQNGLFWIDDSRQELLTYAQGVQSLSTMHGFDAFMINQLPVTFKAWNPLQFDNFVTYYDKLSNDIYYINKNYCLAWNEQSKTFTSFYNYENTPYMMNVGKHSLIWNGGIWAAREGSEKPIIFGDEKSYWITLVCDGITNDGYAFSADKVFNTIEYRADRYNRDVVSDITHEHGTYNTSVFTTKAAWNGYQRYKEFPIDDIRKFNTWRVQLPRATYDNQGTLVTTRDRIRNPFCYIKLLNKSHTIKNYGRAVIHDFAVYFDMK